LHEKKTTRYEIEEDIKPSKVAKKVTKLEKHNLDETIPIIPLTPVPTEDSIITKGKKDLTDDKEGIKEVLDEAKTKVDEQSKDHHAERDDDDADTKEHEAKKEQQETSAVSAPLKRADKALEKISK